MDQKYFSEIKAREQTATPGPWIDNGNEIIAEQNPKCGIAGAISDVDNDFIAHARADIPALIAEVERLAAQLNEEVSRRYQAECNYDHAVKDRDMLKKALELACNSKFRYMPNPDYFIQQAQKQEAEK